MTNIPESILSSRSKKIQSVYIAGSFFSPEEIARVEEVENHLDILRIPYFSPRKSVVLLPNATKEERKACFNENIENIEKSEIMICLIDLRESKDNKCMDSGTLVELGAAYAFGVPIVGLKLKNDDEKVNIMLSEAFYTLCSSMRELNTTLIYGKKHETNNQCE